MVILSLIHFNLSYFQFKSLFTRKSSSWDEIIPVYGEMSLTVYTFLPRWNFIPGWKTGMKKRKKDV